MIEPIMYLAIGFFVAMLLGLMQAHLASGGLIIAATHLPLGLDGARELEIRPPTGRISTLDDAAA